MGGCHWGRVTGPCTLAVALRGETCRVLRAAVQHGRFKSLPRACHSHGGGVGGCDAIWAAHPPARPLPLGTFTPHWGHVILGSLPTAGGVVVSGHGATRCHLQPR